MAGNLLHLASCQSGAPQESLEGEYREEEGCVPLFLFPWLGWWGVWWEGGHEVVGWGVGGSPEKPGC